MARSVRVAVLGGGSWGSTVASLAANNADTVWWARAPDTVDAINSRHENPTYLAGAAEAYCGLRQVPPTSEIHGLV